MSVKICNNQQNKIKNLEQTNACVFLENSFFYKIYSDTFGRPSNKRFHVRPIDILKDLIYSRPEAGQMLITQPFLLPCVTALSKLSTIKMLSIGTDDTEQSVQT